MKWHNLRLIGTVALITGAMAVPVSAQEVIKIGIVGPFTGPFATGGEGYKQGTEAYLANFGNMVGGRKVEVIYRDSGGSPPTAKTLAEELVVKDKVSILGGFFLTPEIVASAPVATEAKVPFIIFSAGTPFLLSLSPYAVRVAQNFNAQIEVSARWGREIGKSRGYSAVADYAPGHVVEDIFTKKWTEFGGTIVGKDRIPLNTVDFATFAERVAAANPDFLNIFIPPGAPAVGYIKALAARGLTTKVTIAGQGEAEDTDLHLFDDSVVGFHSVLHLASSLDNPENNRLKKTLREKFGPDAAVSAFVVGAYDGMHVAYKMIADQQGKPFNPEIAVKSTLGFSFKSPRGPVTIDPATRELTQNFYVREVQKKDGKLQNVVIKTYEQVVVK